jgi:cell division protein FtsB
MAHHSLKAAVQEISQLRDRNQALEVENAELQDQLALLNSAAKKGKKSDKSNLSDQSDLSETK